MGKTCKQRGDVPSTKGQWPPGSLQPKFGPLGAVNLLPSPSPTPGHFLSFPYSLASFCAHPGNICLWPHGKAGQGQADKGLFAQ